MHRTFASVDALPLLCRGGGRGGMRRGRWLAAHFSAPSQVTAAALLCGTAQKRCRGDLRGGTEMCCQPAPTTHASPAPAPAKQREGVDGSKGAVHLFPASSNPAGRAGPPDTPLPWLAAEPALLGSFNRNARPPAHLLTGCERVRRSRIWCLVARSCPFHLLPHLF